MKQITIIDGYEIVGVTGTGYTETGRYNYREDKWLFGLENDGHDGTGTTFESREDAEGCLSAAMKDKDVRSIKIKPIEVIEFEDED